jgi:hypothetical protein
MGTGVGAVTAAESPGRTAATGAGSGVAGPGGGGTKAPKPKLVAYIEDFVPPAGSKWALRKQEVEAERARKAAEAAEAERQRLAREAAEAEERRLRERRGALAKAFSGAARVLGRLTATRGGPEGPSSPKVGLHDLSAADAEGLPEGAVAAGGVVRVLDLSAGGAAAAALSLPRRTRVQSPTRGPGSVHGPGGESAVGRGRDADGGASVGDSDVDSVGAGAVHSPMERLLIRKRKQPLPSSVVSPVTLADMARALGPIQVGL